MGAKGWEQMPMTDFYREFGNLEAVCVCPAVEVAAVQSSLPLSLSLSLDPGWM